MLVWAQKELIPGKNVICLEVPGSTLSEDLGTVNKAETTVMGQILLYQVVVLANQNFVKANPVAARFMELVEIPNRDVSAQDQLMQTGEDTPAEICSHAQQCMQNHQKLFEA